MSLLRKILVFWMIAWLPAAGAMAAVMPLSGSMTLAAESVTASTDNMALLPCHGKTTAGKVPFGQGCTHCVLCHLAGALALSEMPVVAAITPTHVFEATPITGHHSFVPELPVPPPRLSLA